MLKIGTRTPPVACLSGILLDVSYFIDSTFTPHTLSSDQCCCYPVAGRFLWGDSTPNTHSPTPLFQGCPAMACKAHQCELSHESMYWRLVQWSVLHASRPSKHHHVDPQITNDSDTRLSSQPPGKSKNRLHMATSALSLFAVNAMGHRLQCSGETMNVYENLLTSQSWIVSKSLVLR